MNQNNLAVLKVPKLEEPDDYIPFKKPKEEPIDEEYETKPPKMDSFKMKKPKLEEPEFHRNPTPEIPVWKPNIKCVTDFLLEDSEDVDYEMTLGSSVLFDNPRFVTDKSKRIGAPRAYASFEKEDNAVISGKKPLTSNQIRTELSKSFDSNQHQTALECQLLSEKIGVRYKTVVDYFENRRRTKQIECEENDACQRIKQYFIQEIEPVSCSKISDDVRFVLERELEKHMERGKRFSIGYVHNVMERINLHPIVIRAQYDIRRKKLMEKYRNDCRITDYRKEEKNTTNTLSIEILRKLEDAYLNKTYHCEEKEWSLKDIKSLANDIKIDEESIKTWLNKRKEAKMGLETGSDAKTRIFTLSRKLPRFKIEVLNEEFARNPNPDKHTKIRIAKNIELTETQVRNYFNKQRIAQKEQKNWERARIEFLALSDAKKEELERIATEKRKPAIQNHQIARRLGVTYQTLCNFIDWRKSISAAKNNKFRY